MGFGADLVHHPRRLWLRRALFQVHLWVGVLLSLYVIVIALSGAILVFRTELTRTTFPRTLSKFDPAHTSPTSAVVARFQHRFEGARIEYLTLPSAALLAFQFDAKDSHGHTLHALADSQSGVILPQPRTWIDVVYDLHVNLLLGEAHGIQVNGIGAAGLLILAASGLVLWWRGLAAWTRGLRVSFRHRWRRINFDLHSAIGFWTLALVTWWAISGVYFAWYQPFMRAVNAISPLQGMVAPKLSPLAPVATRHTTLDDVIMAGQKVSPEARLYMLSNPTLEPHIPVYLYMDRRAVGDFAHRDIVTVDPGNARVLSVWRYGENRSLGDWFLWAMHPLHFGTLWGLGVKIIWALAGVSLALLTATGLLMYWNRYLRARFKTLR